MSASWFGRAACREPGVDPEIFFPLGETGPSAGEIAAAKAVCARCPVAAQCLDWAIRAGEPAGIWGGTTPEERRLSRSRLARAGQGADRGLQQTPADAIAS
jgi:WhiB family transcriptional regulator, redox-sensing transcriptional regulator